MRNSSSAVINPTRSQEKTKPGRSLMPMLPNVNAEPTGCWNQIRTALDGLPVCGAERYWLEATEGA